MAAACAGALATDGHGGPTYNLCRPDRVTGAERAALLAAFTGASADFAFVSEDQLRGAMARAGLPTFVIDAVTSLQAAQAEGAYDVVGGDLERFAGRSLREVLASAPRSCGRRRLCLTAGAAGRTRSPPS